MKNRRRGETERRVTLLISSGLLVILLCGLGLFYVWQKKQIKALAGREAELRREVDDLSRVIGELESKLTKVESPGELKEALLRAGRTLVLPRPEQILTLPRPGVIASGPVEMEVRR